MSSLVLIYQNGSRKDQKVQFPEGTVTLGRSEQNHLVFDEAGHLMVSRKHAEISWREGSWVLSDSGSTTGTYRNGKEIDHCLLEEGDSIRLGEDGPILLVHFGAVVMGATVVDSKPENVTLKVPLPQVAAVKETVVVSAARFEESAKPSPPALPGNLNKPVPSLAKANRVMPESGRSIPPLEVTPPASKSWTGDTGRELLLFDRPLEQIVWALFAVMAVLTLTCIYLAVRVSKSTDLIQEQSTKIAKMEEINAELVRRLSSSSPVDMERIFQQKSQEMDRRMEQKMREVDQKMNMLLDSNPLAKYRWQQMQRKH